MIGKKTEVIVWVSILLEYGGCFLQDDPGYCFIVA